MERKKKVTKININKNKKTLSPSKVLSVSTSGHYGVSMLQLVSQLDNNRLKYFENSPKVVSFLF